MRPLAWLILALVALSLPVYGSDTARLVSPAGGSELVAGSEAVLEGEAFLSVDGGRTPLRVTPHLDISIRRFTFRVPAAKAALIGPSTSGMAAAPEARPVLDKTPVPRPDPVPVRILISRFNE
jgi:hypothetical protein